MRIQREVDAEEGIINIESLLDVIFILLIFYMATTTFREQETDARVNLADTTKQMSTLSSKKKTVIINVLGEDRKDGDPLYVVSSRKVDLLQLRKLVEDAIEEDPEQKVLVRGDRRAFHEHVANAVRECREVGIKEAHIGYDYTPKD